jgi:hypothetical protein
LFKFEVTAPGATGLYAFQWQMVKEGKGGKGTGTVFFGQMSVLIQINVIGGGGGANDARFISQSVTTPMTAGQTYGVSITMKNIGDITWSPNLHWLAAQNPPGNNTWAISRVDISGPVVPGGEVTFAFDVTAPAVPGLYNFQWQMERDTLGFFGQITPNVVINVSPPSGTNDAAFLSQTVPTTMIAGQTYGVTITMRNTGTSAWTSGAGYRLGSQNPANNSTWGLNRVDCASVPPDTDTTFIFNVTAPATVGTYNFQWQMLQEGVGFFGAMTTNVQVVVTTEGGNEEGLGNNLSVPVIFAESHGMTGSPTAIDTGLRPRPEENIPVPPFWDPAHIYVIDGTTYYPQQTPSTWCAQWANGDQVNGEHVVVNWSDNLLNTRWTPKSVIRVETVLYKSLPETMTAYTMRHLFGSGTTEMWGTDTTTYPSMYRTVYSVNARLKIEKLDRPGGNPVPGAPCGFEGAIYEWFGQDGPGGYTAEVNVSGNLIYGYSWMLNQCSASLQQKLGWWRLTFTLDPTASFNVGGIDYNVTRNVFLDALDPLDSKGTFFKPVIVDDRTTRLEIEITQKGGGKPN